MSDYAADLAERWTADAGTRSEREAIEGAVREALAKAADVADQTPGDSMTALAIIAAIRALGAREGG